MLKQIIRKLEIIISLDTSISNVRIIYKVESYFAPTMAVLTSASCRCRIDRYKSVSHPSIGPRAPILSLYLLSIFYCLPYFGEITPQTSLLLDIAISVSRIEITRYMYWTLIGIGQKCIHLFIPESKHTFIRIFEFFMFRIQQDFNINIESDKI